MYVSLQKPRCCWPPKLPGVPRAEALSVFALTFLFLLLFCDPCLTYSFWRTFGTAPTRSRVGWRQPSFGEEKPSLTVRQNKQTSCSSLLDPGVRPTPSPLDLRLPPEEYWGPARVRVGQRFCKAGRPGYRTVVCRVSSNSLW